jgi:hypothetical protein
MNRNLRVTAIAYSGLYKLVWLIHAEDKQVESTYP